MTPAPTSEPLSPERADEIRASEARFLKTFGTIASAVIFGVPALVGLAIFGFVILAGGLGLLDRAGIPIFDDPPTLPSALFPANATLVMENDQNHCGGNGPLLACETRSFETATNALESADSIATQVRQFGWRVTGPPCSGDLSHCLVVAESFDGRICTSFNITEHPANEDHPQGRTLINTRTFWCDDVGSG